MKQFFYLLTVSTVLLLVVQRLLKKRKRLDYKIISDGSGKTVQNGNFFEIQLSANL